MSKRYYWIRLMEDFFDQKEIKKLRKIAGGDTYVVIYMRIQLISLKTDGRIYFDGVESDLAGELALELDEAEEDVRVTLQYMSRYGLFCEVSENEFEITAVSDLIGSESESAQRVRRFREKNAAAAAKWSELSLQSNAASLHRNESVTACNAEKIREDQRKKDQSTGDASDGHPQDVRRTSAGTVEYSTVPNSTEQKISPDGDDMPPPDNPKKAAVVPVPYEKIRELFNATCLSYSKVVGINGKRKINVGARWNEHPDLGFWTAYFSRVEASPFMKGKNDRHWKASFDWIMQPANMDKVLEGNYDDKGGDSHGAGANQREPQKAPRDYTKGFKPCDD
ncbi:MAG: phage replisome organizer N-terminal domain-containing protein [Oscillospiraceae bacterium]